MDGLARLPETSAPNFTGPIVGSVVVSPAQQVGKVLQGAYAVQLEHQRHLIELRNRVERLRGELAGAEADLSMAEVLAHGAGDFAREVFGCYRELMTRP